MNTPPDLIGSEGKTQTLTALLLLITPQGAFGSYWGKSPSDPTVVRAGGVV